MTLILLQKRQDFWVTYLEGAEERTIIHQQTLLSGRRIEVYRPSMSINNIGFVAQRLGLSSDALIIATFAQVYRRVVTSASPEAIFGLYLSNRAPFGEDLSKLVAPTLNLLPIRVPDQDLATAAKGVQRDLQLLSSSDVVGTSLKEVWEWTGVKVNCFLNLLKSTTVDDDDDDDEDDEDDEDSGQQVATLLLDEMDVTLRKERRQILDEPESGRNQELVEETQQRMKTFEAYLPSIDIEMHLTDHGRGLDIGVFAPCELLGLKQAEMLIDAIGEELRRLQ